MLHHLTLWVPNITRARASWQWLLGHLGFEADDDSRDRTALFRHPDGFTLVLEESADMVPGMLYSRMRPGLNHLAFRAGSSEVVSTVRSGAAEHGWAQLAPSGHPIAKGSAVVYLEDGDGFEVELVGPPGPA